MKYSKDKEDKLGFTNHDAKTNSKSKVSSCSKSIGQYQDNSLESGKASPDINQYRDTDSEEEDKPIEENPKDLVQ